MRNVFLVLVLANLAFAAWAAWFAPSGDVGRRADEGLPALTLVSEVPADLRTSGVVVEAGETEQPPAAVAPPIAASSELVAAEPPPAGTPESGTVPAPPCRKQGPFEFGGETTQYPHVNARGNN